jgi:hypothetical protein
VPEDFRGRFRIVINLETGPFTVKQNTKWHLID